MGIGSEIIELLIQLKQAGYLRDKFHVIDIGAQQLANSFLSATDRLTCLGHMFGIDRPLKLPSQRSTHIVHGELEYLDPQAPLARDFWLWLGCRYAAIDVDGSPGSIPLDLNYDKAPRRERKQYDIVTNFGTTEHVANQLNAFKMIHDLTRHGGLMVHALPAQGMLNHGFVNYNLKFFWMLARSNGYKFIRAEFAQSPKAYGLLHDIVDFLNSIDPTAEDRIRNFKFADAALFIVLEKTYDIDFVPPIDVPTGVQTNIRALRRHYWTVFQAKAFERLHTSAGPYRRR